MITASLIACPICFGDPNSAQVHGARVGVLFLLAVTVIVLTAIALVARSWGIRARKLDEDRERTITEAQSLQR
jgi:uncharacterized membrane protein YozB (DUF420 family)